MPEELGLEEAYGWPLVILGAVVAVAGARPAGVAQPARSTAMRSISAIAPSTGTPSPLVLSHQPGSRTGRASAHRARHFRWEGSEPCVAMAVALGAVAIGEPTIAARATAAYQVRESVEQLSVTGADPGARSWRGGTPPWRQTAEVDAMGSALFRQLAPGAGYSVSIGAATTARPRRSSRPASSLPDQSFYDGQSLDRRVPVHRDPRRHRAVDQRRAPRADRGRPVPDRGRVQRLRPVEPDRRARRRARRRHRPHAAVRRAARSCARRPPSRRRCSPALMGYAVVGVNMRGTGCSGGAYDFFETLQVLDGYDVIEAVAAQDWVARHTASAWSGLSYPGHLPAVRRRSRSRRASAPSRRCRCTATRAPACSAPAASSTPASRSSWADAGARQRRAVGHGWVREVIDDGDTTCAANQALRLAERRRRRRRRSTTRSTPTTSPAPLDIRRFAGDIDVPVFLASRVAGRADRAVLRRPPRPLRLGARSPASPSTTALHADGFAPQVLVEWNAFLDLYVADEVPSIPPLVRSLAPRVHASRSSAAPVDLPRTGGAVWPTPPTARARFEARAAGARPLRERSRQPRPGAAGRRPFERTAARWPDPGVTARRWWLDPRRRARRQPAGGDRTAVSDPARSRPRARPRSGPAAAPTSGRRSPTSTGSPRRRARRWPSRPRRSPATLTMLGTGSVDLWVRSDAADADLEVVLSEVRPDGEEMLVQSGRLRASYRALEPGSSELHPVQLGREADVAPLPRRVDKVARARARLRARLPRRVQHPDRR